MHSSFWKNNPALLFGITFLIGTSSFLFWSWPWNGVFPTFWIGYLIFLRKWPPLILLFLGMIYSFCLFGQIDQAEIGYFSPASLQPHQSPFAKSLLYKGMLTVGSKKVPCCVHAPFTKDHPKANCDYLLKGKLKKRGPYDYLFSPQKWTAVKNTFSFAELRFQMKENIRSFLDAKLKRSRVALFLSSLLTGDVEDRMLRFEFSRLGLQHILAISGFHFAILISFCSFFLGLFLPKKGKIIVLICAINIYFLFVGALPAVQRSYLTVLFFLIGKLLRRNSGALNLLGASLLVEVLIDPFIANHLGFQLSFLSCIGILLFRPLFLPLTFALFPKHKELSSLSMQGYLITTFLREAISITLAVNAAILPLLLYHFHSFPLLSLLYNLFFPFLVSIALFLLLLSLLFDLLFPLLSIPLYRLTDFFTAQLLDLTAYPPLFLDHSLKVSHIPAWLIPIYLFFLFCLGIHKTTNYLNHNFSFDEYR